LIWNFFATSHGKGEVDGVRALLKCEVRKEQIKPNGRQIQNVVEVVAFLRSKANKYHVVYPNVK
jgi:DNA-binding protein